MPVPEFPITDYAKDSSLQALLTQLATPIPVSISGGVTISATSLEISNDLGNPIPVSASALPLPSGAATSAKQDTLHTDLQSIDGHVDGVETLLGQLHTDLTGTLAVSGPLTDTQLRAAAVPVSAAALPLPTGAASSAKQDTAQTSLTNIEGYTDGIETLLTAISGKLPSVLATDRLKVDGSGVTQPVSATALPLPTGAATQTTLAAILTALSDSTQRIGGTVAVSGPLTDTQLRASAVSVDSELPAAAALADTAANPAVPSIGTFLNVYNGSTWDRTREASTSDAVAATGLVTTVPRLYNGTTFDNQRGNVNGTLLASAARTATATAATQTNYNARGVIVYLNVTAASGTGGLTVRLRSVDPISGGVVQQFVAGAAITTTGLVSYGWYPGGVGGVTSSVNAPLPRSWDAVVSHGDSSSYTYSLGFAAIL